MISPQDRRHAVDLINKAVADGARAVKACQCLNLAYSTYRKWMNDPDGEDGRPRAIHAPNSKALCI